MDHKANITPYDLPEDAVWFVTGCSSGIGRALAEVVLAHPTYRLVATARDPASLSGLAGPDEKLLKLPLDVTSQAAIDSAVDATVARFGRVDVLVNNAGYGLFSDAEAATREEERRQVETNFWGPLALCKHAVRVMRDENPKNGGRIGGVVLNVTSFAGFVGFASSSMYHASKFALEGYTESFAKEVLPEWNIHFCIIEPGGVVTDFKTKAAMGAKHPAYASPDAPGRRIEAGLLRNTDTEKTFATSESVARAMIKVILDAGRDGAHKRLPIRLPLGVDSYAVIKGSLEDVGRDLEEFKELTLSVRRGAAA